MIAGVSEYVGYANANTRADALMDEAVRQNPSIYPPAAVQQRLYVSSEQPPEIMRWTTRSWNKLKSGR
ncbi:Putrescine-binding periplasmic protein precursor [compost metagenome]